MCWAVGEGFLKTAAAESWERAGLGVWGSLPDRAPGFHMCQLHPAVLILPWACWGTPGPPAKQQQPRARQFPRDPRHQEWHPGVPAVPPGRASPGRASPAPPGLTPGAKSVGDGQERNPGSGARLGLLSALPPRLLWRGAGGKRGREQLPLWRSPGEALAQPSTARGEQRARDTAPAPGTARSLQPPARGPGGPEGPADPEAPAGTEGQWQ